MNLQPAKLAYNFIKSPRPPVWVNIILLIIFAFWLAPHIWQLFSKPPVAAKPIGSNKQTVVITKHGQQIAALHVFGKAPVAAPVVVAAKPKEIPLTKLNLILKGVLANNPQEFAYALVAQGSGNTDVYAVGDKMPGGAKLLEVYADRIIIDYNSRHETLMLQELQAVDLGQSSAPVVKTAARPRPSAVVGGRVNINPQRATALRQDFLSNPTKLLNMVSIKPYMQNGTMVGYTINPKGDPALYNELGLLPNDVVVSVNGIGITDIPNLNKLTTASSYDVMLLRDGQQMSLSLSFQ